MIPCLVTWLTSKRVAHTLPFGRICFVVLVSGQIVGERGERRSPSIFGGGTPYVPHSLHEDMQLPTTQATEKNVC